MSAAELFTWLMVALQGITVAAVFVLVLLVALSVLVGAYKLRHHGRAGARSLDELVGDTEHSGYLPSGAPRGPIDQLKAGVAGGRIV